MRKCRHCQVASPARTKSSLSSNLAGETTTRDTRVPGHTSRGIRSHSDIRPERSPARRLMKMPNGQLVEDV